MASFSNGTEAELYRERYCMKCVHDDANETYCAVWEAHLLADYDQHKEGNGLVREVLETLIPTDEDGRNLACTMFLSRED